MKLKDDNARLQQQLIKQNSKSNNINKIEQNY